MVKYCGRCKQAVFRTWLILLANNKLTFLTVPSTNTDKSMRSLYQSATIKYNRTHCSSQRWSGNPSVCDVKIIFIILNHCLFHFDICTDNAKKWRGWKKNNVGQNCYSFSTNQDRCPKLNSIQLHGLAFKKDNF